MLVIVVDCYGASLIQIQKSNITSISELWHLQIISSFNSPQIIHLKISAYNTQNILLYEAFTDNFLLQSGISNFNSNHQQLIHTRYLNEHLPDLLGNGNLSVVISMFTPEYDVELSQTRQMVTIKDIQESAVLDTGSAKRNRKMKVAGTVELTGLYNTREDTLFYMPFNYTRLQTHHQIDVQKLPFTYDMYVTSEQKFTKQKINFYRLKFDYNTFKERILTKAKQKINTVESLGNISHLLNEKKRLSKTDILDSLKSNQLIKEEYLDLYKEYIPIDSLKQALKLYDDVQLKKTIAKLLDYGESLPLWINEGDNSYTRYINEADYSELSSTVGDTSLFLQKNYSGIADDLIYNKEQYVGMAKNTEGKIWLIKDSSNQKVQDQYHLLLTQFDNNQDSLNEFLEKLNRYKVQDFLSFSKVKDMVNDKIVSYEKHYENKEIKRLKKLIEGREVELDKQINSLDEQYNIWSRKELLLNGLKRFEAGTVYPNYSHYTVQGVVLNGYDISYTYKNIYASFSGGKQVNIINDSINHFTRISKPILFVYALGYGVKNDNHIHFNYAFGSRQFNDILQKNQFKTVNHVFAPDFLYRFQNGKWSISGELPVSITDKKMPNLRTHKKIGWAGELSVLGTLFKNTLLEMKGRYLGENFQTFGVPYLFSSYLDNQYKIKQKITNSVSIESGYSFQRFFNTVNDELGQMDIHTFRNTVNVGYKKWNVNLTYAPIWMGIGDETRTNNTMHSIALGLSSSYAFKKGSHLSSSFGYNYNSFYNAQTYVSDYGSVLIRNKVFEINKNSSLYLIERLTIANSHVIGFNFSLQKNHFSNEDSLKYIVLGVTYSQNIKDVFNYTISYQAMNEIQRAFRHHIQCQLDYMMNRYLRGGVTLYYDYLDGIVESKNYNNTNAFQIMANLIFRI